MSNNTPPSHLSRLTERQRRQIAGAVAEVDPAQIAASAHLSMAQKMSQGFSMIEFAEEVASYRVRQLRPDLDDAEAILHVRKANLVKETGIAGMAPEMASQVSFRQFSRIVLDIIQAVDLEYLIGGSVAAWAWGEARTTRDFDLVIDLPPDRVELLSAELKKQGMLVPPEVILDLMLSPVDLPINAIHMHSGYKAEFFLVREGDLLRQSAFERRLIVDLGEHLGEAYVHSPEDLILYKLQYYKLGQQPKHIRDIVGIFLSVGQELEMDYLNRWIEELDLSEIWQEIQRELAS